MVATAVGRCGTSYTLCRTSCTFGRAQTGLTDDTQSETDLGACKRGTYGLSACNRNGLSSGPCLPPTTQNDWKVLGQQSTVDQDVKQDQSESKLWQHILNL